jgi:hypothetical protein
MDAERDIIFRSGSLYRGTRFFTNAHRPNPSNFKRAQIQGFKMQNGPDTAARFFGSRFWSPYRTKSKSSFHKILIKN